MSDWMWGFMFGVLALLMFEGISWVVVMFWLLRGIEAPPKPLWSPKTQKMIAETAAMGEEMVQSVKKMEGKDSLKCPKCGTEATGIDLQPDISPITRKPYQFVRLKPCGHDMGKEELQGEKA